MRYVRPGTVDEAVSLLNSEPESCVFAGATDLVPQMQVGRPEPKLMIDLKGIPRLVKVSYSNGQLVVGAATPVSIVKVDDNLKAAFPGLSESSGLIGSDQIQNRASLGGNLCTASPGADTIPSLMVNSARVVIASSGGTRTIPVSDVVTGPGSVSLKSNEFVVEFILDAPPKRTADAYLRFIPRTEMDIAVVDAAARLTLDDADCCTEALVAIGAAAPTVVRAPVAENALRGNPINDETLADVMAAASAACSPISDKRGTKEYRRQVAGVLAKRVVLQAAKRAKEKGGAV